MSDDELAAIDLINIHMARQEVYNEILKMAAEMQEVKQYPGQATYSRVMGSFLEHLVVEIKQRLS